MTCPPVGDSDYFLLESHLEFDQFGCIVGQPSKKREMHITLTPFHCPLQVYKSQQETASYETLEERTMVRPLHMHANYLGLAFGKPALRSVSSRVQADRRSKLLYRRLRDFIETCTSTSRVFTRSGLHLRLLLSASGPWIFELTPEWTLVSCLSLFPHIIHETCPIAAVFLVICK